MRNRNILLAAALCFALSTHAFADEPIVAVQTAVPERGEIAQSVRAYGVVAASASNLVTVNLPYVARIVRMLVQAGQPVKRGTPLFVVQADPTAALGITQARSAASLADGELERTKSLFDKGLATGSQLAAAKKAVQDAHEALAAQQELGASLGSKTINAPENGVVLQVQAGNGDQIQAGTSIVQLASENNGANARGNVVLGVEAGDATHIRSGDVITLHGLSTALSKQAVSGRVALVGASIDPQSQLVNVGANVSLTGTAFIPGTRVSADIATSPGTHWVVPRSALLHDDKGDYVYQVTTAMKAQRIAVALIVENGAQYGVDGPLDPSRPIVVTGNYELSNGMSVHLDQKVAKAGSAAQ